MVSRETGRREFIFGTGIAGTHAASTPAPARPLPDDPALAVPGLDSDPSVRWTFEMGSDTVVFPVTRGRDALFTVVRKHRSEKEPVHVAVALDPGSGAVRWRRTLDWQPSFPQAANGLVYIADGDGRRLLALDPNDGSRRWSVQREDAGLEEFVVDEQSVFTVGGAQVTAIDATEGGVRWQTGVKDGERLRKVLLADERVYVGGERGFYALDRSVGRERWMAAIPGNFAWPAAVRDGLLVGWSDDAVYAVDVADGVRRWRTELVGVHPFGSVGTVTDDTAYVWGEDMAAIGLRTGERRWTYDADGRRGYSPEVAGGQAYFPAGNGTFVALDVASGQQRWQFDIGDIHGYWGSVADGLVYFIGRSDLYVVDAESGRAVWTLGLDEQAIWADVVGDLAFVGTGGGSLYAIDRPSSLATAPVATVERFATSPTGLGLLGLLGAGLFGAGYRRFRTAGERDPDLPFGRLDRLGGGPVTETYRKRVRTPDGPALVAETRLTDDRYRDAFVDAVEQWADLVGAVDGVLPVLDHGTDPARFETPYVSPGSLADSWPVSRRARVEVASAVARTLHAAHGEGVVHGRLAPRHVFPAWAGDRRDARSRGQDVLVAGWFVEAALADARDVPDPYAPLEGSPGTDESGVREADAPGVRGDVYRAGALAHHLLTGAVPRAESGLARDAPGLPDELADVLERALAADPADRYESALAFDDAFRWGALDR